MSATPAVTGPASVYALLADGTTIEIRPASPGDSGAVRAMHEAMSPDNAYLRFFNLSRRAAEQEALRICRPPAPDHIALLAPLGRPPVRQAPSPPTATGKPLRPRWHGPSPTGSGRPGRRGRSPEFAGLRPAEACALVTRFLASEPNGGWLAPAEVARLLACYGIPLAGTEEAVGGNAAAPATAGKPTAVPGNVQAVPSFLFRGSPR